MELILANEQATARVGAALARALPDLAAESLLLGLSGELGSGKTTLARGLLRALGVEDAIHSPTFTLIEPYVTARGPVHHVDLYRLDAGPEVLEGIGFRDLRGAPGLVMVEWPERAGAALGVEDLAARLALRGEGRSLALVPGSERGRAWLDGASALLEKSFVST